MIAKTGAPRSAASGPFSPCRDRRRRGLSRHNVCNELEGRMRLQPRVEGRDMLIDSLLPDSPAPGCSLYSADDPKDRHDRRGHGL
jgi:hypothetical protein